MELLEKIINKHHGYLLAEDMEGLRDLLGDSFRVVIKDITGHRCICTLKEYFNGDYEQMIPYYEGIKEVFITAKNYKSIEMVLNNNHLNKEDKIRKIRELF